MSCISASGVCWLFCHVGVRVPLLFHVYVREEHGGRPASMSRPCDVVGWARVFCLVRVCLPAYLHGYPDSSALSCTRREKTPIMPDHSVLARVFSFCLLFFTSINLTTVRFGWSLTWTLQHTSSPGLAYVLGRFVFCKTAWATPLSRGLNFLFNYVLLMRKPDAQ